MCSVLVTVACSSSTSTTQEADPSAAASSSAPATDRDDFEEFFRKSLRQVDPKKLDCMVEELSTTLSDEQAAEFVEALSSGGRPPPATLETVSAAAKTCRAGSLI